MNAYRVYEYCQARSVSLSHQSACSLLAECLHFKPSKNKQQIDLRISGTNRKSLFCANILPVIYQFMSFLQSFFSCMSQENSICSFTPQIFIVYFLCARNCYRHWEQRIKKTSKVPDLIKFISQWKIRGNKQINTPCEK